MARAMGKVRFVKDNKMAWFMYDATMDRAYAKLFDNYNDFYEIAWEKDEEYDNSDKCMCSEDEEIEIYESYGGGLFWKGRACRNCMVITKNFEPVNFSDEEFPEWCEKDFRLDA